MDTDELEQRLRDVPTDAQPDVRHYLDDMGWSPEETLERMLEWIYQDGGRYGQRSNAGKAIRRIAIDYGWYEEGEADYSYGGPGYAFIVDGTKYRFAGDA